MTHLFIKEELKKILQSKHFFVVFVLFLFSFILPGIFLYTEDVNEPIIFYSYNIFASNIKILYPLIAIYLYSWNVGHEYTYKTIYILKNTKENIKNIIISKFISSTLVLSLIYIVFNFIYLLFLLLTTDINNIYINGLDIKLGEFIIKWLAALLLSLLFLICIGTFSMMMTMAIKKWFLTSSFTIVLIILLPNIPLLDIIRAHSPISGFYIPQIFYTITTDYNYIFKTILINLIFIIFFLILTININLKSTLYHQPEIIHKEKKFNAVLWLLFTGIFCLYSLNEYAVLAKVEDNVYFSENANTINRMTMYMKKNKYNEEYLLSLGDLYGEMFLYDNAEETYQLGLERNSNSSDLNYRLMNSYLLNGELDKAEQIGINMLDKNIESVGLYESMSLILLVKDDFELSLKYINLALSINVDKDIGLYLTELSELITNRSLDKNNIQTLTNLITFIDYDTFKIELIKKSLLIDSVEKRTEYVEYLAQYDLKSANWNASSEKLRSLISTSDSSPQMYDALIVSYTLIKDSKQLKELQHNNYQLSTSQKEILNILVSYLENDEKNNSLQDLDTLIENQPNNQEYFYTFLLGKLLADNNKLEDSQDMFYKFLNAKFTDTTDQNYWFSLQENAINTLSTLELKTN